MMIKDSRFEKAFTVSDNVHNKDNLSKGHREGDRKYQSAGKT
jgi:hypothetical protein